MYKLFCYYENSNKKYDVYITRNIRARRIVYRLKDDKFYITAPQFSNNNYILEGLKEKAPILLNRVVKEAKPYNKDGVYFFGEFIPFRDGFITIMGKTFLFLNIENFYERVKDMVLPYFENRTRQYEQLMGIKEPYNVKIRYKETNYGVNSRITHTITYNIILIHYSQEISDSVIVHELAHHFVFNHSKSFYNVVYQYMPNYKQVDRKLRKRIYK